MLRIYHPLQLMHPKLVGLAGMVAQVETLGETTSWVEDFIVDVPADERVLPDVVTPWPWDADPKVIALSMVQLQRKEAEKSLAKLLVTWLKTDREN